MVNLERTLRWIVGLLQARDIPFHITGGYAAHLYGATRAVNDIDIDLPREALERLAPELLPWREFGPAPYSDATFQLYLMTINYHEQVIDLTAMEGALVHNKNSGGWDLMSMHPHDAILFKVGDLLVPVQHPSELIEYKEKILFDEAKHDVDVAAVRRWMDREAFSSHRDAKGAIRSDVVPSFSTRRNED